MRIFALALALVIVLGASATEAGPLRGIGLEEERILQLDSLVSLVERTDALIQENERLMSVLLAVALGPFGGHRLYLGTGPKVPIIYTLTLGGGFGVLPTIDLVHLLLKKDMGSYRNNPHVFMWAEPGKAGVTPP